MSIRLLIVENYRWLENKARIMCFNREDAYELLADTILKILENECRFDPGKAFRPWAHTIMYNMRTSKIQRKHCVGFFPLGDMEGECDTSPEDEAQATIVRELINRLAREFVSVKFLQLFAYGYTVEELSDKYGISPSTVRTRLFNGRRRVRDALTLIGINVSKS